MYMRASATANPKPLPVMVSNGIGFWGLIFIVLIALKISGAANISWFWVFSAIWIPTIFTLIVVCGIGFVIYFLRKLYN